ncbi:MAG TPA: hypothetical protein VND93_11695 [Myxococcales bacterium]|jgi:hypothetical protein|nr:hypothetical protein [Myxococcales bacterium]
MSGCSGVNSCGPSSCQSQVQKVQSQQQDDQQKQLDIMKQLQEGKISPQEAQAKLQALTEDQARLQASLAPGAATASAPAPSSSSQGFGFTDSFDSGAGKRAPMVLNPTAGMIPADFLDAGGGGSKPSVAGGLG